MLKAAIEITKKKSDASENALAPQQAAARVLKKQMTMKSGIRAGLDAIVNGGGGG